MHEMNIDKNRNNEEKLNRILDLRNVRPLQMILNQWQMKVNLANGLLIFWMIIGQDPVHQ